MKGGIGACACCFVVWFGGGVCAFFFFFLSLLERVSVHYIGLLEW